MALSASVPRPGRAHPRAPLSRPRPTAWLNASTGRTSANTSANASSARRRSPPRRSLPTSHCSSRSGRMRRWGRRDKSSRTAQTHVCPAAACLPSSQYGSTVSGRTSVAGIDAHRLTRGSRDSVRPNRVQPCRRVFTSLVGKMSARLPIRKELGETPGTENTRSTGFVVPPAGIEPATPGLGIMPQACQAVVDRAQRCCTVQGSEWTRCWAVLRRAGPWWGVSSASRRQSAAIAASQRTASQMANRWVLVPLRPPSLQS
jgi:hypothetical protein